MVLPPIAYWVEKATKGKRIIGRTGNYWGLSFPDALNSAVKILQNAGIRWLYRSGTLPFGEVEHMVWGDLGGVIVCVARSH